MQKAQTKQGETRRSNHGLTSLSCGYHSKDSKFKFLCFNGNGGSKNISKDCKFAQVKSDKNISKDRQVQQ